MRSELRFWGVRGSLSVGSSDFGTQTSCVELALEKGPTVFFDAGSGIRSATYENKPKEVVLCLSHFHWDHIQGLPYLSDMENPEFRLTVLSSFPDVEERLSILFDPRFHPVPYATFLSKTEFRYVKEGEIVEISGLKIQTAKLSHPGDSYAFSMSSPNTKLVYATDSDYDSLSPAAQNILRNADIAIMDSQFLSGDLMTKADYGHSSFRQAIDIAIEHRIKQLYLFHFDPNYDDAALNTMNDQAQKYVSQKFGAEGLRVGMAREGVRHPLTFI